jgi:GDPmannose 4,6-dehydratase
MWRILQHTAPDDFVGATGESHSVGEFAEAAFRHAGISDWKSYVRKDDRLLRPADVHNLRGNPAKAERLLGWKAKTRFAELVRIMVDASLGEYAAA